MLFHERSKYQDVLMLSTPDVGTANGYGKVLVLDGVIQVTERDQFAYAEMITHLPLFAHKNPEHVLLIGGGDGAVLCEIVKHKSVKSVTICEIDEMVIDMSKRFYPQYADIWKHPKLKVHVGDGAAFLDSHKKNFDVVIVDSSDPVGPAEVLFQKKFFKSCKRALRSGGILCTQGECMWLHVNIISAVLKVNRELFPTVEYAYGTIPTYPSGQIGYVLCCKDADNKVNKPKRSVKKALGKKKAASLQYYTTDIHGAAFVLPSFVKDALKK